MIQTSEQLQSENFIGLRVARAAPMTLGDYNRFRGWDIPANEDPAAPGYIVEASVLTHEYVTWIPKVLFEHEYSSTASMPFGHAVFCLKAGHKVARAGWNEKGMWLMHVSAGYSTLRDGAEYAALPYIVIKTAGGEIVPWVASQTDVLADDWSMVS